MVIEILLSMLLSTLPPTVEAEIYIPQGEFELTAYTLREEECGKAPDHPAFGITRSGEYIKPRALATDWDVLPNGTTVYIPGMGKRTVMDTGGAIRGNRIDVYMGNPYEEPGVVKKALEFGRQSRQIYVIEEVTICTESILRNQLFTKPGQILISRHLKDNLNTFQVMPTTSTASWKLKTLILKTSTWEVLAIPNRSSET